MAEGLTDQIEMYGYTSKFSLLFYKKGKKLRFPALYTGQGPPSKVGLTLDTLYRKNLVLVSKFFS